MKKLLALILCVMMFVSVVPTSAFALTKGSAVDNPLSTAAQYNKQIKNMIKNTKADVENAYKSLVSDEVVYAVAKGMDDTIVSLVDGIANPMIDKSKFTKTQADGVKDALRSYFDAAVAKKIGENQYKAYDSKGNRDDLKYAQVVADAVSAAMNDKDFVAGYQAVATYFALASIVYDIQDNLNDARDEFLDGVDPKFQADFAAKYTNLVSRYIDTVSTAAVKAARNDAAAAALMSALVIPKNTYNTAADTAKNTRDAAYTAAETTRDGAINTARGNLATAKQQLATDEAQLATDEAQLARDKAQLAALKAQGLPDTDPRVVTAQAAVTASEATVSGDKTTIAGDEAAVARREAQLESVRVTAQNDYNTAIKTADTIYAYDIEAAQATYDASVIRPYAQYNAALQEINPWGLSSEGGWTDYGLELPDWTSR